MAIGLDMPLFMVTFATDTMATRVMVTTPTAWSVADTPHVFTMRAV